MNVEITILKDIFVILIVNRELYSLKLIDDISYGFPLLYLPLLLNNNKFETYLHKIEEYLLLLIENELYGIDFHPSISPYILQREKLHVFIYTLIRCI